MRFFKKRGHVVDLGERMKKQQQRAEELRSEISQEKPIPTLDNLNNESTGGSFFSFLGNGNSPSSPSPEPYRDLSNSEESDEKRRKLAKRLSDITEKLEELSNSIYKIEQRLDLVERKLNLGGY